MAYKSLVYTGAGLLTVRFLHRAPSLRAKGTLISEPRSSTPCEMRFCPREKGKTAFVEGFSLKRPFRFPAWENRISQGVEDRGSLISVPSALRVSGIPNTDTKSQRFSYAISQIAPLPPVVALHRSFNSQIAARYAEFWRADPQIALASFL